MRAWKCGEAAETGVNAEKGVYDLFAKKKNNNSKYK